MVVRLPVLADVRADECRAMVQVYSDSALHHPPVLSTSNPVPVNPTIAFFPTSTRIFRTSLALSSWVCLKGVVLLLCDFPSMILPLASCTQPSSSSASTRGEEANIVDIHRCSLCLSLISLPAAPSFEAIILGRSFLLDRESNSSPLPFLCSISTVSCSNSRCSWGLVDLSSTLCWLGTVHTVVDQVVIGTHQPQEKEPGPCLQCGPRSGAKSCHTPSSLLTASQRRARSKGAWGCGG